jgi:hypothetical protein
MDCGNLQATENRGSGVRLLLVQNTKGIRDAYRPQDIPALVTIILPITMLFHGSIKTPVMYRVLQKEVHNGIPNDTFETSCITSGNHIEL